MPKRNNLVRHSSEEVMGEDSFVLLRRVSWGEAKRRNWLSGKRGDMAVTTDMADDVVTYCVVDWNWVDDDGHPLPIPSVKPEVVDELTLEETSFILEKVFNSKVDVAKKKKS